MEECSRRLLPLMVPEAFVEVDLPALCCFLCVSSGTSHLHISGLVTPPPVPVREIVAVTICLYCGAVWRKHCQGYHLLPPFMQSAVLHARCLGVFSEFEGKRQKNRMSAFAAIL